MLLARPISHTSTWISSKFSTLYWICLLFIFLVLVDVELPLCIVVTLLLPVLWSQVEYKIVLFYLLLIGGERVQHPVHCVQTRY